MIKVLMEFLVFPVEVCAPSFLLFFGVCCEIVDVQMDAKTYLILSM